MPRAKRAWCASAAKTLTGQPTGSLSKDSGELCKLRNPHRPQALALLFSRLYETAQRPVAGQKTYGRGRAPAISHMHKGFGRARLLPLDLHHLIGLGAAGRDDLDLRAFLLADQCAGEGGGDGNLAFFGVRFGLADDLPHRFFVGVFVD
jgi:hypothetical protein